MWLDVAACFEVCEASGAAVGAVLERLANTIEADQDAAALRETALAGPRATVRLLSWLPFIGLGLGMVMGVDPLTALLGGPVGWTVMAAGAGFAIAGWAWSARMIAAAARPVQLTAGRRPDAKGLLRTARARRAG
jgi:tight adherence protein B